MSQSAALLQLFVVTPVCHLLLTDARIHRGNRRRGLTYAVIFLAAVALFTAYSDIRDAPPSYYAVLNVPTTASTADIRRAYKAAAVRLHPDKNPSHTAAEEFTLMTAAYEVLEKPDLRLVYDRYGAEAAQRQLKEPSSAAFLTQLSLDSALFYVVWLALTYILCLSREAVTGRNVSWVVLFITAVVEYQMLFAAFQPLQAVLPHTPVHAQIRFLHYLYPSVMHACRLLSQFLFVDYDALERAMMRDILISNRIILATLTQIQASIDKGGVRTAGGVEALGERGIEQLDDGTGTSGLPLPVRLQNQQSRMERLERQLMETKAKGSGGLPSWLVPVGLLLAFNYFGSGNRASH